MEAWQLFLKAQDRLEFAGKWIIYRQNQNMTSYIIHANIAYILKR
ncbi:hypothetical protein Mpsy_2429 [Methanolobus psychrophilus R15]|nr:hypothetical protein Mpsy_2429 [Methanolobus psychrophilus R15]